MTNIATLQRTIAALSASPAVQVELARQAQELRERHRTLIERRRRAESRVDEVARESRIAKAEQELAPLQTKYLAALEKFQGLRTQVDQEDITARNEAWAVEREISELPLWNAFDAWRERIDAKLSSASYLLERKPPNRPTSTSSEERYREALASFNEHVRVRIEEADNAARAFRATVNSARLTFCDELEAIEACQSAFNSLSNLFTLKKDHQWEVLPDAVGPAGRGRK